MAALTYSRPSLVDIENIKNFIAADSVAHANRFVKIIRGRITLLKKYPGIGKPIYPKKFKTFANCCLNHIESFIST